MSKFSKYIESDIHNGLTFLKCAIMNALADIESGERLEIDLGDYVPFSYVVKCAEDRGWKCSNDESLEIEGFGCDCWYYMITPKRQKVLIKSCLFKGQPTKIIICNG